MSFDAQKLFSLLPAVYRLRDIELAQSIKTLLTPAELLELQQLRSQVPLSTQQAERLEELEARSQRGPLSAMLSVIAEQSAVIEDNLDQLYDDLFIETCAEWVVPYIGDLVGARGITTFPGASFTERAFVANTMAYRRRKGTAAVLEQLARDLTDWDASVVEYFQLLATTQYMNHIRLENVALASLKDSKKLEFMNTPFDQVARTADVRRIQPQRGKYNIPNIGIYLWRIASYSITDAPAFKLDDQRYLFDAFGKDVQLYNDPQTEDEITHLAGAANVPFPFSRPVLDRYLNDNYGRGKSVLVNVDGSDVPISPTGAGSLSICVCDLSDVVDSGGNVSWAHRPAGKIAIDPILGRIAFPVESPPAPPPRSVRVMYHYGFSANIGGGEYNREESFINTSTDVFVPKDQASIQPAIVQIISTGGVVEITTSDIFFETPAIAINPASKIQLELRAADENRPVIAPSTDITVTGGQESEVTLNGLIIAGSVRIPQLDGSGQPNKLRRLRLRHCTLVPGAIAALYAIGATPPLSVAAKSAGARLIIEAPNTSVEIERCIVGPIQAIAEAKVSIKDSIVDATAASEVAFSAPTANEPGAPLTVENSTIIGKVYTRTMKLASNTIFFAELSAGDTWPAPVRAERLQQGCVRFSFVPPASQLPRKYHCQPPADGDDARIRPAFKSLRYGDAAYCQLSPACSVEITTGSDDQGEMGALHQLYQPRREANLRAALDEYLRFGLEAGIFYAS